MQDNQIRSIAKAAALGAIRDLGTDLFSVTTSNATATEIALIEIEDYSGGILEVLIVGKGDTGTGSVTAKQIVRYEKTTTLTLGTPSNLLSLQTDITGATFSIASVSNDIKITVTGAAATTINWTAETKLIYQTGTTLP